QGRGDPALPGRGFAGLSLARGHAESHRLRSASLLSRVLHRAVPGRLRVRGTGAAQAVRLVRSMDPLTYRAAGVDIRAGDEAVRGIVPLAATTHRREVLGGIGALAAFCRVPSGYLDPVLVSSTDGVGTKLRIAIMADRHDTVGLDLVAMGVNDLLVHGAEPLFFLDYLAVHQVDPDRIESIVKGIAAGCRPSRLAPVGGD